jgi:hypothetical protein
VTASLVAVLAVFPRFSIIVGDVLLENQLLSVPMEVSYDGYLPLRSVRSECVLNSGVTANEIVFERIPLAQREIADWLMPGDAVTVGCFSRNSPPAINMNPDLLAAEISIYVDYKVPLLPFQYTKHFAFGTEQTSNGKVRWMPLGLKDRPAGAQPP